MARPFSYPEVKALEVGHMCVIPGPYAVAQRRVSGFAKRCKPARKYDLTPYPDSTDVTVYRDTDPEPRAE